MTTVEIPIEWQRNELEEVTRMRTALEAALKDRVNEWGENELESRRASVKRSFDSMMLAPSHPNGNYSICNTRNLIELISEVVDMAKDMPLVPDRDQALPFGTSNFEPRNIISSWMKDKIQIAMPEEMSLTYAQINDCFLNVSESQLQVVIEQIALSGLSILPETGSEKWARLSAK